jgi:hypothetical protein
MVPAIDLLWDFCGLRHWLQQQLCSQIMFGPTKPKDLGAWSYPLLGHPSSNQISKVDIIMAALTVRPKKPWAIDCPKPKPKWWLPICWSLFSPLQVGSQYNLGFFFSNFVIMNEIFWEKKRKFSQIYTKFFFFLGQKTKNNCWKRNIQHDPYPMFIFKFPWPFLIVENNVKIMVNLTVVTLI